jgi:hypothetical protein|tara:strand:- start:114 stop:1016 length:903 start_codon:yes stop_codon:yes gene_type:complete
MSFIDDILRVDSPDYSFDTKAYMGDFDPLEDNLADFFGGGDPKFNDDGFSVDFLDALYGRGGDLSDYSDSSIDDFFSYLTDSEDKDKPSGFKKLLSQFFPERRGSGGAGGLLELLGPLAISSFLKDRGLTSPKIPSNAYEGSIPEYTAVREQVTGRDDTSRRPGSGGRRYFSDTIYAKKPEGQQPMSVEEAQAKARAQAAGFMGGGQVLEDGGYLQGVSDGQADLVPADIDGVQEARLSHGEYVLPADLVAILGNGNSDAGAAALDDFMSTVRKKATGTPKQQKNIDADQVLAMLSKRMS